MKSILLKNGNIIDVDNLRIFKGNILIEDNLIAEVSVENINIPDTTEVIDCAGLFVSPGLIDAHIHIESSMLSPAEFARNSVTHGTTTVMVDPHEISNIFGIKAIKTFMDMSDKLPFNMLIAVSSCVPATDMETSGAFISLDEMKEIMDDQRIYGLAEMMNFPGIINGFGDARQKVDAFYNLGKLVDGHAPGVRGDDLLSYISNGKMDDNIRIMNDHETSHIDEALEKLNAGMYLAIRYGSATKDMDSILAGILTSDAGISRCMLCSDDLSAQELFDDGHMDRTVRRATAIIMETLGLSLEQAAVLAISMATKNVGEYLSTYHKHHDLPLTGVLAVGRRADIAVFKSLEKLEVDSLFCDGKPIIRNSSPVYSMPAVDILNLTNSVKLKERLLPEDFSVFANDETVSVRVIDIVAESLLTGTITARLPVINKIVKPDAAQDIALIAVFERHQKTGGRTIGFVKGLGIKSGALASTVAHDSHNLIVAGYDPNEMAELANAIAECGGGIGVLRNGKITLLALEIGGLMSKDGIENVSKQYKAVKAEAHALGSKLASPFMTMSFLSLPVIPELKITDKGLVDVNKFEFVSIFV